MCHVMAVKAVYLLIRHDFCVAGLFVCAELKVYGRQTDSYRYYYT